MKRIAILTLIFLLLVSIVSAENYTYLEQNTTIYDNTYEYRVQNPIRLHK